MENKSEIIELVMSFRQTGDQTDAFSFYDGKEVRNVTYSGFFEDILRVAGWFLDHNVTGRHIALIGQNSYAWIAAFMGIAVSGNCAILLNPDLSPEVLHWQCEMTDVDLICGADAAELEEKTNYSADQVVTFSELLSADMVQADMLPGLHAEDTLLMMFTSGTTGKSKAVEFSVRNVYSYLEDVACIADGTSRIMVAVPLHHVLGLLAVLCRLYQNHTVCMGRGIRYMLQDLPALNPDFVPMVPSVLESLCKMLKHANSPEARQKYIGKNLSAISVGGASANLHLCRFMMDLGIHVQSAYGMTETTGAGTWCVWDETNIGSIGKLYGRTECCIRDGELLLRGPTLMKGYYKDPEETAKLFEDGWIHTGDMGYCDENGYYYLTGRKKNVIILSNGENVNPEEIEAKFADCKDILECLVYSDGKGICADVYTQESDAAAAFIKEYNQQMPFYRQVYKVNFTTEPLEKTGSGKIKRKVNA